MIDGTERRVVIGLDKLAADITIQCTYADTYEKARIDQTDSGSKDTGTLLILPTTARPAMLIAYKLGLN